MADYDKERLSEILETLEAAADMRRYNALQFFVPYPKQTEFFDMGAFKRERLLIAGNQLGKTEAGAVETAYHLTGLYPADWLGHRFDHPIRAWAGGESGILVRDVQQKKLCGAPGVEGALGTGYIPKNCFVDKPTLARGVTDAFDTIQVQWHDANGVAVPGAVSTLTFKTYEQGRTKWQGEPVDWIWNDEEPPEDIYSEGITRTNATGGLIITTFTPLKGMSTVVGYFLGADVTPERGHVTMTIYDALHYTPEQRAKIIASYPAHERDARTRGVPMMGSGRIFPYPLEMVQEPALEHVPEHWAKLWSIDFGIAHPFGAVLSAWDRDADVWHILHTIRVSGQGPLQHAVAMKAVAAAVPVAWPHDGNSREKGDNDMTPLKDKYKAHGLLMLPTHAAFPDGSISTEAGIQEMDERIQTGRLKVAAHLADWAHEFSNYHRKDGMIVKEADDLMSATRIGLMARRYARAVAMGSYVGQRRRSTMAQGLDFDIFGG